MIIGIDAVSLYDKKTGIEQYTLQLIKELLKIDNKNQYVIFFRKEIHPELKSLNHLFQAQVCFLSSQLLAEQLWLPFVARKMKLSFLHSPGFSSPVLFGGETINTIFDLTPFVLPQTISKKALLYFRILFPICAKRAKKIITTSHYSKNDIIKYLKVNNGKIEVTPMAAETRFKRINDKSFLDKISHKHNLPKRYILSVSTLEPRKNYPALIEAFAIFKRQVLTDYKLVIVGRKGWLYNDIFAKVKSHKLENEVIFLGHQNKDLPGIYNLATLFVFPSLFEGFGLTPLEAMACGVPVITSNVSSLPEVVGDCAILVNPNNIAEIADAIKSVLVNDEMRQQMRVKGLKRASEFSWQRMALKTLKIYHQVGNGN